MDPIDVKNVLLALFIEHGGNLKTSKSQQLNAREESLTAAINGAFMCTIVVFLTTTIWNSCSFTAEFFAIHGCWFSGGARSWFSGRNLHGRSVRDWISPILLNKLDQRVQFNMRKVKSIKFTQNGKSKLQQVDRTSNQAIKMSKFRNSITGKNYKNKGKWLCFKTL